MDAAKLEKLQAQVRIGGKGTARRKRKVLHRTTQTDDKKIQATLKRIGCNVIPGIEEVNIIKTDSEVLHLNCPKVQASISCNTFAISGHAESKTVVELLPGILPQLGPESFSQLKQLMTAGAGGSGRGSVNGAGGLSEGDDEKNEDDEEVPQLMGTFDDPSKKEA